MRESLLKEGTGGGGCQWEPGFRGCSVPGGTNVRRKIAVTLPSDTATLVEATSDSKSQNEIRDAS